MANLSGAVQQLKKARARAEGDLSVGTFVTYALKHYSLNPTFPTEALDSSVRAEIG
jgi:hypothetical protein